MAVMALTSAYSGMAFFTHAECNSQGIPHPAYVAILIPMRPVHLSDNPPVAEDIMLKINI
jgi:hypothetical protein